ncbi:MAG: hypothetical protein QOF68_3255, partial [Gaiellales bacterium]|nr:hypothetical protein [Gaiellales bacterium]
MTAPDQTVIVPEHQDARTNGPMTGAERAVL